MWITLIYIIGVAENEANFKSSQFLSILICYLCSVEKSSLNFKALGCLTLDITHLLLIYGISKFVFGSHP